MTPLYGCVCAYDTTSVLQSIRFEVPNVEIETLCQRACSCPQLRGGPEQRDFTASCLHGAISPTCAFPPISHLQSRKWELGSIDENDRNLFETPKKGPVFVPTIRHHQNEPTDPPIWCWHQHQTKMLVCHLCFREGGQFAWPKMYVPHAPVIWSIPMYTNNPPICCLSAMSRARPACRSMERSAAVPPYGISGTIFLYTPCVYPATAQYAVSAQTQV